MPPKIALQLYSVRDALAKDYAGVIKQIAAFGYSGVETAGYPGSNFKAAAKLFRDHGLTVCSAHTGLPVGDSRQQVLDEMKELGCTRIVTGRGLDDFKTLDQVKKTCDFFNKGAEEVFKHNMSMGIHNHWWEFQPVEGRMVYHVMKELLNPKIFFEVDTYWAKTGGCDPAAVVRELGARAPLLHIKDGPCVQGKPMVAVGDGVMDFSAISKAGAGTVEWMIVELDSCATDMLAAVGKSYTYLTSKKFATGKR